jgi:hypothetical protein
VGFGAAGKNPPASVSGVTAARVVGFVESVADALGGAGEGRQAVLKDTVAAYFEDR